MNWLRWGIKALIATLAAAVVVFASSASDAARELAALEKARPSFTQADVRTVAVVLTYEARVFPEPLRTRAFHAVAWTMRNRVATGYGGATGYDDQVRLLSQYLSYIEHMNDVPDPEALVIAGQVLAALTNADDETNGARHYCDNSYWTGTHEQTGVFARFPGKHPDTYVHGLVDDGRFVLSIEWKTSPGHPRGLLFYGLYFFDGWPPPEPPEPRWVPLYRSV